MVTDQQQLNRLLDRVYSVLVVVHNDGPIPKTSAYRPVRAMVSNGFSFSIRELVQAIGCKMANLPLDNADQALSYASIYTAS